MGMSSCGGTVSKLKHSKTLFTTILRLKSPNEITLLRVGYVYHPGKPNWPYIICRYKGTTRVTPADARALARLPSLRALFNLSL
jgi:hypothetical protein